MVDGGLTSELLLDFDLSKSFVMRGNLDKPSGIIGFIFKPVIKAVNNTTAGRLEGLVTDTAKIKIKEIKTGKFARTWIAESKAGRPNFERFRKETGEHTIEKVGAQLRSMMPWLKKKV